MRPGARWLAVALALAAALPAALVPGDGAGVPDAGDRLLDHLRRTYPSTRFLSVSRTPAPGLFAVRMPRGTAYTDPEARRMILGGTLVDLGGASPRGLPPAPDGTAIPEGSAFHYDTSVPATATVTVFSDLDCPHCVALERDLAAIGGLRVSVVLYPVARLRPDWLSRAAKVWCAHNPAGVYLSAMLDPAGREALLDGLADGCDHPVESGLAAGRELGIGATPTLLAPNGARLVGRRPAGRLRQWVLSNQRRGDTPG